MLADLFLLVFMKTQTITLSWILDLYPWLPALNMKPQHGDQTQEIPLSFHLCKSNCTRQEQHFDEIAHNNVHTRPAMTSSPVYTGPFPPSKQVCIVPGAMEETSVARRNHFTC